MALAKHGPGQWPTQETVSEGAYGWAQLSRLVPQMVRGTCGVGRERFRVVGGVSRTPAPWLTGMHLHQGSPMVDADQLGVCPDFYICARRT